MSAPVARPGRVITFYSYKGGTGRSLALSNVAWILAAAGKSVLIMDWDLEAPGLHRYFKPFLIDHELASSNGLMDLIDDYATEAIRPAGEDGPLPPDWWKPLARFEDYVLSINFGQFPPGGRIDLLPAGRQTENYAVKVSAFNWQNFYDRLGGGGFLEEVRNIARSEYDYVLIDSRTGVSDTAGICTAQMPDKLVVCFTYNNQSIKGAAAVAHSSRTMQAALSQQRVRDGQSVPDGRLLDTPAPFRIYPIPMRAHDGEAERLKSRQAYAREVFADLLDPAVIPNASLYWSDVEVPHKLHYAYEEVLAPLVEDPLDQKTVLASFIRMTRYLSEGEVTQYNLPIDPERRQEIIDSFSRNEALPSRQPGVAESEEQALVRMADTALVALDDTDRAAARSVLGRLVRIGRSEEGGRHFPIRVALGDIPPRQLSVCRTLSTSGLLAITTELRGYAGRNATRVSAAAPEQVIGLADERLVVQWPQLAHWLEEDIEFLLWRQQLRDYRLDWMRTKESAALLSGSILLEARNWARDRPEDLNDAEFEFIEASADSATSTAIAAMTDASRYQLSLPPALPISTPTPTPSAPSMAAPESAPSTSAAMSSRAHASPLTSWATIAASGVMTVVVLGAYMWWSAKSSPVATVLPPEAQAASGVSTPPAVATAPQTSASQAQSREVYAASLIAQTAPNSDAEKARRARTRIEYFAHSADDAVLGRTLGDLGFTLLIMQPRTGAPTSNIVWYGAGADPADIKLVAIALIQAHAAVRDIQPVPGNLKDKADAALIQFGASQPAENKPPLTVEQVTKLALTMTAPQPQKARPSNSAKKY